ncbi:30S ribosomal protein S8 [Nitrosomonas sp.]|uniref:30S ribosomal protein S8 n=1 Tax=Nitrosomonas sp. TaxID=42353 RepID=UPI00262D4D15|nr:30S ribosomal protein S8 [Nitrosomonas sp.]MBE7526496.1 30S ribosomal protein S8 [Burkholderiales bacterium]MCC6833672.1 30S ribosomal protein S8 [Cytophagales bacterium]
MCMTDPVADMLTRIRNAQAAEKKEIKLPSSRIKLSILKILEEEGYIQKYQENIEQKKRYVVITLKYFSGSPVISTIKRISKPGLRIYKSKDNLPNVMNGLGIGIISTSKGVLSIRQAKKIGVGGELLCIVT